MGTSPEFSLTISDPAEMIEGLMRLDLPVYIDGNPCKVVQVKWRKKERVKFIAKAYTFERFVDFVAGHA